MVLKPVYLTCALIVKICGLNPQFKELKASIKGGPMKSAVANYWCRQRFEEEIVRQQDACTVGDTNRCNDFVT